MNVDEIRELGDDVEACPCMTTTMGELRQAIRGGCRSIEALIEATDVGTGCELCHSREVDTDEEREIHLSDVLSSMEV